MTRHLTGRQAARAKSFATSMSTDIHKDSDVNPVTNKGLFGPEFAPVRLHLGRTQLPWPQNPRAAPPAQGALPRAATRGRCRRPQWPCRGAGGRRSPGTPRREPCRARPCRSASAAAPRGVRGSLSGYSARCPQLPGRNVRI